MNWRVSRMFKRLSGNSNSILDVIQFKDSGYLLSTIVIFIEDELKNEYEIEKSFDRNNSEFNKFKKIVLNIDLDRNELKLLKDKFTRTNFIYKENRLTIQV